MTNDELKRVAEAALAPMKQWAHRCHEASVALVNSGAVPGARVARGTCRVVGGQHSWVCLGDPYDENVVILDPALWSYTQVSPEVWVGGRNKWRHRPHGDGNIFEWGRPDNVPKKFAVDLPEPAGGWSPAARKFLEALGPVDLKGWRVLAHAPVRGWPATEILRQMCAYSNALRMAIPVDIRGMVVGEVSEIYPRCPR